MNTFQNDPWTAVGTEVVNTNRLSGSRSSYQFESATGLEINDLALKSCAATCQPHDCP